MREPLVTGVHHVTAFAKSPRENRAFYEGVLGLRMVKRTVNFDDPLTYHLYYGDEEGTAGTLLTHFPNPRSKRGAHGAPEICETRLAVATGGLDRWAEALRSAGVAAERAEGLLAFEDPDGMRLSLVEDADHEGGGIGPVERVVIRVRDGAASAAFLERALGFEVDGRAGASTLLELPGGGVGRRLELVEDRSSPDMRWGAGVVHHVAWRVPDDGAQAEASARLRAEGCAVTPVMDRQYFRSIYFRIPGGVVFEIATDGPGFGVDEPLESLGSTLRLPPQHEARRAEIEAHLEEV